jgi:hypothetical protein
MYAPVVIFAYNRPAFLKQCVKRLSNCAEAGETALFVFCDGPKENASAAELQAVAQTHEAAKSIKGFKSVQVNLNKVNEGLTKSVIAGITKVLSTHSSVIVLEDDLFLSHQFLTFMNAALQRYEHNNQVAGISGFSFPINEVHPYFSRTGSCWGWATYQRVWENFLATKDTLALTQIKPEELKTFNVYDAYYATMYEQQQKGLVQSWAIEFYLSYFVQQQVFLFSGANLVVNAGFDGSGAHHKTGNFLTDHNPLKMFEELKYPEHIGERGEVRKKLERIYQKGLKPPGVLRRLLWKIPGINSLRQLWNAQQG